jgi:hypothetical protein
MTISIWLATGWHQLPHVNLAAGCGGPLWLRVPYVPLRQDFASLLRFVAAHSRDVLPLIVNLGKF